MKGFLWGLWGWLWCKRTWMVRHPTALFRWVHTRSTDLFEIMSYWNIPWFAKGLQLPAPECPRNQRIASILCYLYQQLHYLLLLSQMTTPSASCLLRCCSHVSSIFVWGLCNIYSWTSHESGTGVRLCQLCLAILLPARMCQNVVLQLLAITMMYLVLCPVDMPDYFFINTYHT